MSNYNENKLLDSYNRVASKLRISVTDKCNFRCNFCMPDNPVWLPQHELLTFEEIHRLATVFAKLGINTAVNTFLLFIDAILLLVELSLLK